MRSHIGTACRQVARGLILGCLAAPLAGSSAALAQGGVAGSPPVFTGPPKPSMRQTKAPSEAPAPQIRVQSNLVTTPITVMDSSGDFVYDLTEDDFQVLDSSVPQKIERFDVATEPLAAVIVVETSDAVAPLIEQIRPIGPIFSSLMLGPKGEAAVITYSDQVQVVQDFTEQSDRLSATLRDLKEGGGKARLNDALARALALLERRPKTERRVIIAFSDGFDRGSETNTEEVLQRATSAEVTIYGLGFNPAEALLKQKPQDEPLSPLDANVTRPLPPGVVPTATNSAKIYSTPIPGIPIITAAGEVIRSELASSLLEYYAGFTGGVFYSHWSKNALQNQLGKISSEINSQYELAYVPSTLDRTGFHHLEVEVRKPGMKVRARAGYFYERKNP